MCLSSLFIALSLSLTQRRELWKFKMPPDDDDKSDFEDSDCFVADSEVSSIQDHDEEETSN